LSSAAKNHNEDDDKKAHYNADGPSTECTPPPKSVHFYNYFSSRKEAHSKHRAS